MAALYVGLLRMLAVSLVSMATDWNEEQGDYGGWIVLPEKTYVHLSKYLLEKLNGSVQVQ